MKPECIDNFLGKKEFDKLQKLFIGGNYENGLPWLYQPAIDYPDDLNKFQFIHVFYKNNKQMCFFEALNPIFQIINPISLWRIKANLLTRTPEIVENAFHTDFTQSEEKLKQFTTSIFYINTNNGYTKFEDGTKIESVANRMVFFSSNMKHTGTSCTDEKIRVVINFNYFKQ